mmetsp:Transcript_8762/g.18593  ORF Transcript_8762/g.18593 Transcript_8762/m.18593 type:complete len:83 (-) Transcript_8762:199-447(-)
MAFLSGLLLFCSVTLSFLYYTLWVLLLPMWEPEDAPWLHAAFPPRIWALKIPGLITITLVAGLTLFVGLVLAGVVGEEAKHH